MLSKISQTPKDNDESTSIRSLEQSGSKQEVKC